MLFDFAVIISIAFILYRLTERIKLPGLLGMLLAGVLLGPSLCGFISKDIEHISGELRTAALIVILIRAGFGINRSTLHKVGLPALMMSFIPCICEGTAVTVMSHYFLKMAWPSAGMLGFILAAVSPAVVIPQMLDLKEKGWGKDKEVPTLVLAGASLDDVFAITIFGIFLSIGTGQKVNILSSTAKVPLGILVGTLIGVLLGFLLFYIYKTFKLRATHKVIIFMITAIIFHHLETIPSIKSALPITSLLGIMAMGFVILEKNEELAHEIASKFNKIWVLAEILLFVLIGAQVQIDAALKVGLSAIAIIIIGLAARSLGVYLALCRSHLNSKEKLFCAIAYLPKATVQAAIGAVPLSKGISDGNTILAMAVISILLTAPLGAILIRTTHTKLLQNS